MQHARAQPDVEQASPAVERAPVAAPTVHRVLELQRSAGNRAVAQLLRREGPVASGTVSQHVEEQLVKPSETTGESTFHWDAKFAYQIWDDTIVAWVNIRMDDSAVGEDVGKRVRDEAREAFRKTWNKKFVVIQENAVFNDEWTLSLGIDFIQSEIADEPVHAYVKLLPGAPSKDEPTNRSVWHVEEPAKVHAHEPGHLFGLTDEYVDTNVVGRTDAALPAVHEDNSIMGDYPNEGVDTASMKDRHALAIATAIWNAEGRNAKKLKVRKA